jgi:hypothetical protein
MFHYFGDRYKTIEKKTTGRRNIFVYDDLNNLVCIIKERLLKNRKEIIVYEDESESRPVLHLESKKNPETEEAFSIFDGGRTNRIGRLKQRGYKWSILDDRNNVIAELKKRTPVEMLKDDESGFFPKKYVIRMLAPVKVVAEIRKDFALFSKRHHVDFSRDHDQLLDRRLGLSAFVAHLLREKPPKKRDQKEIQNRAGK